MLQGLWSFVLSEAESVVEFWENVLLDTFPADVPSVIVLEEAPPQVAARRIEASTDARSSIEEAAEAHRRFVEVARLLTEKRSFVKLVVVNNGTAGDLGPNLEKIAHEVEQHHRWTARRIAAQ
jgi:hypothetical protein